jgi:hypothetical protein
MSFLPLDGPSRQAKLSVTQNTVVELKIEAFPLPERKAITVQGSGRFYMFFGNESGTPSTVDLQNNGFTCFKDELITVEAGDDQRVFVLAADATINIVVAERG